MESSRGEVSLLEYPRPREQWNHLCVREIGIVGTASTIAMVDRFERRADKDSGLVEIRAGARVDGMGPNLKRP
jgi:hypothetical protein